MYSYREASQDISANHHDPCLRVVDGQQFRIERSAIRIVRRVISAASTWPSRARAFESARTQGKSLRRRARGQEDCGVRNMLVSRTGPTRPIVESNTFWTNCRNERVSHGRITGVVSGHTHFSRITEGTKLAVPKTAVKAIFIFEVIRIANR